MVAASAQVVRAPVRGARGGKAAGEQAVTNPEKGHLALDNDEARNLIRVVGRGRWSLAYFDQHIRSVEEAVRHARHQHGFVRLLMDLRGATVQTREVSERMTEVRRTLYKPLDRLGLVLSVGVMKLQIEDEPRQAITAYFTEPESAEAWLLAEDAVDFGSKLELEWGPVQTGD
jgi:hypothetical protein